MRFFPGIPSLALRACVLLSVALASSASAADFYIATNGNDNWSGRLPVVNPAGTDGPLATLNGARNAIRTWRSTGAKGQPVTVYVRGGTYPMDAPFFLESQDSGTAAAPVCYTAQPGERPLFSGGQVLRGWKPGPGSLWSVSLPEAASGRWNFHQLFVNGQRRTRARSPNQGFYYISAKALL